MTLRSIYRRLTVPFRSHGLILLYHRVAELQSDPWGLCVTPAHFEEHMSVLRKFEPMTLQAIAARPAPRSVAVTFDDGYADNLETAKPLIEKHDIPATFFIATGYIGCNREFWWDELENIIMQAQQLPGVLTSCIQGITTGHSVAAERQDTYYALYEVLQPLTHGERREVLDQVSAQVGQPSTLRQCHRILTAEEVNELAQGGLAEIGAHTVTHPRLSAQTRECQQSEIRESKAFLESVIARPVTVFSYPYGAPQHYSAETCLLVEQSGFRFACTTNPHVVTPHRTPYELPRLNIEDMDGESFESLLSHHLLGKN